jgi:hypothetical protein
LFYPWGVGNDRKLDQREEVGSKASMLIFGPCEGCFVVSNEVVHKVSFFGPKKVAGMVLVDNGLLFNSIVG